MGIDSLFRR